MCQRSGISRILKLSEHFGVRDDLCRMGSGETEEVPQERRLRHCLHRYHIARQDRLDQGVEHIGLPSGLVTYQRSRPRMPTEEDPLIEIPAECLATLRPRPVQAAVEEEAAGEALGCASSQEHRRGAEE